jgi:iron complex outermembrane receptor protein
MFFPTLLLSAEDLKTKEDTVEVKYVFNPIVKTATKVDGAQRDIAASISLIGEPQLMLAPTNAVLEIVQHMVPSLYVTEWGVMGFGAAGQAAGKISIRGMGGGANTHVLILRNGRPDFMGLMGCTIADEFSSDGVERIEVIRGPGSFLYGTNATGGIINIIPKKITENGFQTRMKGGVGAFDTRTFSLSHGGKTGRFDYLLTANHRQTDGHREDSDYKGRHYTAHMGIRLGDRTILDMNLNLADMVVNDPGPITDPKSGNKYDIIRYGGDLNLIHDSRWGETNLKFHGNFGHHEFFDGWRSNDRTLGLMVYQNAKPWQGNTTTVGFDYKRYGGNAIDASADYGEIFLTEYAPYIHMQQLLIKRVILSGGLRVEHNELYGNETLPKLGLVFHPTQSASLRLSAAKGFRSPSIRELYFWMPANDRLTPDRLWNYEIGLSQDVGRLLHVELAVFQTEGRNLIQLASPPPRWVNSGAYTHRGYEIILNAMPMKGMEAGAAWSHMRLSEDVFNIPEKKFTAHMNYRLWSLTLSGNLLWVQDLVGADFPGPSPQPRLHPMEDYAVLNLSVTGRAWLSFIGWKLAVKNVLDAEYQSMFGYPMPGRHILFDIHYSF